MINMKRALFDALLFVFVFLLPWWMVILFSIIGIFVFKSYYEFLFFSIIVYILYSVPKHSSFDTSIFVYLGIIVFYLLVQYLRRSIILYKNELSYKA